MAGRSARVAAICLSLACATGRPGAAARTPQRLSGVVLDRDGAPISNATVIVRGPPGVRLTLNAGDDGKFSLVLYPGVYDVVARTGIGKDAPYAWERDVALRSDAPVSLKLVAEPKVVPPECRHRQLTPPAKVSGPDPYYTDEAWARKLEGTVKLKCILAVDGIVRGCLPVQSLSSLTESAIEAVEQRTYSPALCDGKPIEVDYTFRLQFRMPK
ncbi:MAG TPA: energy transducer TonB [Myxococcales bacterium]